jgi:hypothetical protein
MDRDFEKNPYTPDEQRVSDYIQEVVLGLIGSGDDPIGWLITHTRVLRDIVKRTYGSVGQGMIVTGITEPAGSAQQITVPAPRKP